MARFSEASIFALIAVICAVCLSVSSAARQKSFCTEEEKSKAPCVCCKMRCWYDTQATAKTLLGHVPGTRGEGEALATLTAMQECVASSCSNACASHPKRRQPKTPLGSKLNQS